MATVIRAPYPSPKVTMNLPSAEFRDNRGSEATVAVKRSMLGRVITYVNSSERQNLALPLTLTRKKELEVNAFLLSYQSATWEITLHDGSKWEAQLTGQPIERTAIDRIGSNKPSLTGTETIQVTLIFSAKRLN